MMLRRERRVTALRLSVAVGGGLMNMPTFSPRIYIRLVVVVEEDDVVKKNADPVGVLSSSSSSSSSSDVAGLREMGG
jgi:hypothetical protein